MEITSLEKSAPVQKVKQPTPMHKAAPTDSVSLSPEAQKMEQWVEQLKTMPDPGTPKELTELALVERLLTDPI